MTHGIALRTPDGMRNLEDILIPSVSHSYYVNETLGARRGEYTPPSGNWTFHVEPEGDNMYHVFWADETTFTWVPDSTGSGRSFTVHFRYF